VFSLDGSGSIGFRSGKPSLSLMALLAFCFVGAS